MLLEYVNGYCVPFTIFVGDVLGQEDPDFAACSRRLGAETITRVLHYGSQLNRMTTRNTDRM